MTHVNKKNKNKKLSSKHNRESERGTEEGKKKKTER